MKAKITSGRISFLVLCLTVLFSVMGISVSAEEATCTHSNLKEDNWVIVQEANCKEQGKKTQVCKDCGTKVEVILPPDSNAHVKGEWTTITPHSCQSDGYEVIYCYYGCMDDNGKKIELSEIRTIPAHDYAVVYREDATCQKEGYKFIACTTCFDSYTETIDIDEDAHCYTSWYTTEVATCSQKGEKVRECLECGLVEKESYLDSDNHTKIVWDWENKVPATCKAPGYIPGECEDCKKEMQQEVPQHSDSDYIPISKIASTCFTHGVERRHCACGYEYEIELPLDDKAHVYGKWEITKEPSCTAGVRYKYCEYHSDAKEREEIPATGEHNYGEWVEVITPDCSKTGLEVRTCTDCDKEETRALPTKHDYCTWITIAEMSCNEAELKKGTKLAKCDNCNFEKYFTIPAVHTFDEWGVIEEADCETGKPGVMERTCSGCKKVETKEYTAEHDFTDWYVTGEPVCAKEATENEDGITGREGRYTRWCNNCRKTEHKTIGVNHEFVEVQIESYPVCKQTGEVAPGLKTVKCKFCDVTDTVEFYGEHNFGEWVVTKEGDCVNAGERARTCICCGYVEKEATSPHDYGLWLYDGKKIDCEADYGKDVTLQKYCTRPECNVCITSTFGKVNHPNKITVVTEATCTTSGYTVEICLDCGAETVVGDIIPAKGHTLDEDWSSRNEPTCHTPGSRYKECADCDYVDYREVEKTDHILMELTPGLEPTCTEGGYTSETMCTVCKEILYSKELAPLGHDFSDGTGLCKVCKVYEGVNCVCDCHSKSGLQKIVFSIINKFYQMFGLKQYCSCGALHYEEPGFFAKLFGTTTDEEIV